MTSTMKCIITAIVGTLILGLLMVVALAAPKIYPGPYEATVVRVVDADTAVLAVDLWPGQVVTVSVRLNTIDTPETFRPQCDAEKALAKQASDYVRQLLPVGHPVRLQDIFTGKFAGRVVGTIVIDTATGTDTIARALVRRNFARPYFGKGPRPDWCE